MMTKAVNQLTPRTYGLVLNIAACRGLQDIFCLH